MGRERPSKRDGGEKEVAGVGIGEIGSNREDGRVGRETGGLIGGGGANSGGPEVVGTAPAYQLVLYSSFRLGGVLDYAPFHEL